MGKGTGIQWCDDTVNSTTGCDGCELWTKGKPAESYPDTVHAKKPIRSCYAGVLQEGRLSKSLPHLYSSDFTEVRLVPGRMAKAVAYADLTGTDRPDKPWLNGKPRTIFVGDMGDIYSKDVPFEYLESELIDIAESKAGRRHILMSLTKQPRRAVEFARWLSAKGREWPANLWQGTSITSQATLGRINHLLDVSAKVRFLSIEPLLGPVDLKSYLKMPWMPDRIVKPHSVPVEYMPVVGVDWCILGGESGPNARRCDIAWIRSIVKQCKDAGVACFVKQLGARPFARFGLPVESCWHCGSGDLGPTDGGNSICNRCDRECNRFKDPHGGDPSEWPEQFPREFPSV